MTVQGSDPVVLTDEERQRFGRDGFVVVDRPLVTRDEVAEVRLLLERLSARFDRLPDELAYDLGDVKHHDGPQQIPEINSATELEPQLSDTAAFRRCRDLARQFFRSRAVFRYDHAICKPADSRATVEWHQDAAYSGTGVDPGRYVDIWLALQDTTESIGCMRYIPRRGRGDVVPHHRRGGGTDTHTLVADAVDASDAVACPLTAGMVVVHQMTTMHSSGPNTTDTPRLAWVLRFRDPGLMWWTGRIRPGLSKLKRSFRR